MIDYNYMFDHPVLGGELGYKFNFTSLTPHASQFRCDHDQRLHVRQLRHRRSVGETPGQLSVARRPRHVQPVFGEADWRRSITDQFGQVFTPFASVRADMAAISVKNDPSVSNYINTGDTNLVRAMPTVGLEYRYPFINVQSWGTQHDRADRAGHHAAERDPDWALPNEDAQTLVFDDSNLFRVDKFSGWDRVEGGGRANVGVQCTTQFNQGGFVNVLFGQSYSLFGQNSFAVGDATNTGLNSGLDTRRSDYVARASYQPNSTYKFTSRFRFDEGNFAMRRMEFEASANFDRWNALLLYGDYAAQPEIGFLNRRQGILGSGQYKIDTNWVLLGSALYDLNAKKFSQTRVGIGYIDDCLILGLNYITNYTYSGNVTANHQIMLQLSLRTLGGTSVSQTVGAQANSN